MEKDAVVKKTRVRDLLVLCSILDSYHEFSNNLTNLLSNSKYSTADIYKLFRISSGEHVLGANKLKKFYIENKKTIDKIEKFSSICEFINLNYDGDGNLRSDSSLDFFYQYMLDNKDNIDTITEVLLKLKNLGVSKLEFNEQVDFSEQVYYLYTNLRDNIYIKYLDNLVIMPNYEKDKVEYTTKGSSYMLVAGESFDEISDYNRGVIVNTLIFNPSELPTDMKRKTIFDKIVELKNQQTDCAIVRNSVDLSVGVDDLCSQFNSTNSIIEKLDNVENKEEFHTVLVEIKERLDKLQTMSSNYDEKVTRESENITKEKLAKEKQLFLDRRYMASIDSC